MSRPWKCEKCGKIEMVGGSYEITADLINHPDEIRRHIRFDGCQEGAKFVPYDRRAPADDLLRELRDAAQHVLDCDMAEQEWDAERLRTAVARADAHLAGREPQNYSAALREAFIAGWLAGKEWMDDLDTEKERKKAEVEVLRFYPEPPKEDGR